MQSVKATCHRTMDLYSHYVVPSTALARTTPSSTSQTLALWTFLLGLGAATYINLGGLLGFGGYIAAGELFLLLTAPFILNNLFGLLQRRALQKYLLLCIAMVLSTILSDIINRSEAWQYTRGIPRAILFILGFLTLVAVFWSNYRLSLVFYAGTLLSQVVALFAFKNGHLANLGRSSFEANTWTSDYCHPFFTLTLLASAWLSRLNRIGYVFLYTASLITLVNGSRSQAAAIAIGTTVALFTTARHGVQIRSSRNPLAIYAAVVMLVSAVSVFMLYRYVASAGYMSEGEIAKFEAETSGSSSLTILMKSRGLVLSTILGVIDRPLLGHGSWPLDKGGYNARAAALMGKDVVQTYSGPSRLTFHSLLFGDWVQWGIVYGIFWCIMMYNCMKLLLRDAPQLGPWACPACIISAMTAWDILFSPVGNRLVTAANCALIVTLPLVFARKRPRPSIDSSRIPSAPWVGSRARVGSGA